MPALDRHDDVFVLDIGDTENRFHPDWLASVSDLLDEVENAEGPRALVTAATGKFFSNGLDLDWLSAHPDDASQYLGAVHELVIGSYFIAAEHGDKTRPQVLQLAIDRLLR